jgi:hypothetical protein
MNAETKRAFQYAAYSALCVSHAAYMIAVGKCTDALEGQNNSDAEAAREDLHAIEAAFNRLLRHMKESYLRREL